MQKEEKLLVFLKRDKSKASKQKKLAGSFKNFLKNFSSFEKFKKFLTKCEDTEIKKFLATIKKDIPENGSYKKFLNFCNYTTDDNRLLVMVTYHHYFSNMPKRHQVKVMMKGIEAKSLKSKKRRKEDEGTDREYMHFLKLPMNEVTAFIHRNGGRLRAGISSEFENVQTGEVSKPVKIPGLKEPGSVPYIGAFKSYKIKDTKGFQSFGPSPLGGIMKDYGFLRTFAFKYHGQRKLVWSPTKEKWVSIKISAHAHKGKMETFVAQKGRRAGKFEESTDQNWSVIIQYLKQVNPNLFADDFSKESKAEMTLLFKMLKLKKYADFDKLITSTCPVDRKIAKSMRSKFLTDFVKKLYTYKSVKPKK